MPASALSDALSIIYRALFRMEVKGIDNLNNAGPNLIIALSHVSFLDAGLALSLRNRKPVFAIDVGIAKKWWVRPFVRLTNAMPLDPMKPMAIRSLIDAVKAGNALIIFPEGRITVTGSLMKVYDGAAMIADKADAEIVPVRIEGLEQTPFSRLSKGQVRRRWFPKVTVTILEPVRLTVDPELKGRKGRVPAMINFTAGAANILAACRAAQIDTILSSRVFVDKAKLTNLVAIIEKEVRIVYLEDVRASVTIGDKVRGLFKANRPLVERKSDDSAAILFTSGSA